MAAYLAFIKRVPQVCLIKDKEDKLLNDAGLQMTMPEDWDITQSPFARYQRVGIRDDLYKN